MICHYQSAKRSCRILALLGIIFAVGTKNKTMYILPIDEISLLKSIPGFDNLTTEAMLDISITSFEYSNQSILTTATLMFRYKNIPLKYELSCGRQDGFCYRHILFEDSNNEKEFPGFREAIDYCNLLSH